MADFPDWAAQHIVSRASGSFDRAAEGIIREATNAMSYAFDRIASAGQEAASEYQRPSVLYRPQLIRDGNQWCVLYGENLQEGVAGFGDSPAHAMYAFDQAWLAKIPASEPERGGDK